MAYQQPDPVSGQQPPLVDGGLVLHQLLLLLIVQDLSGKITLFGHKKNFEKCIFKFGASRCLHLILFTAWIILHKSVKKVLCFPNKLRRMLQNPQIMWFILSRNCNCTQFTVNFHKSWDFFIQKMVLHVVSKLIRYSEISSYFGSFVRPNSKCLFLCFPLYCVWNCNFLKIAVSYTVQCVHKKSVSFSSKLFRFFIRPLYFFCKHSIKWHFEHIVVVVQMLVLKTAVPDSSSQVQIPTHQYSVQITHVVV